MKMATSTKAGPSLNRRKKTARQLPADASKAQRAIVRKGDGYIANVPDPTQVGREDLVLDQQLRINALELTLNSVLRKLEALEGGQTKHTLLQPSAIEVAKSTGAATPHVSNVTPMRKTSTAESKKLLSPASVDGNEATQLPLEDQSLPAPPTVEAAVVHIHGTKVPAKSIMPAANDEDVSGSVVSDYNDDTLSKMLTRKYGLSKGEQYRIIKRELARRDASSMERHGMSYGDLRIARAIAKQNAVGFRDLGHLWITPAEVGSAYKVWSSAMDSKSVKVLHRMKSYSYDDASNYAFQASVASKVKAGRLTRKARAVKQRKLDMMAGTGAVGSARRFTNGVKFARFDAKVPSKVSVSATISSKVSASWGATKMGWRDSIDRISSALGMGKRDWFKSERQRVENVVSDYPTYTAPTIGPRTKEESSGPDYSTPTSVLVRNMIEKGACH